MTVVLILLGLLGTIGLGLPIAFSLAAVSIVVLALNDVNLIVVVQRLFAGTNSFPLLAVPLFILAGQIMGRSGISGMLVDFARALVGAMKGGLAAINIVTSMFFAGMSGTSMSDTAAVGGVMIPQMIRRGYSRAFAGAVTASSSTIGIIIPPSVPMVILASFMQISTGALFAAGMLIGLLLGIGLIFAAWVISVLRDYPAEDPFNVWVLARTFLRAAPALAMPAVILGGILGGVFTPTEAAAVAVVYGILIAMAWYRTLTFRGLYTALAESAVMTGAVMLVTATAHVLGYTFTYQNLGEAVLGPLLQYEMTPILFLMLLSIVMIVAGTVLDGIAMMFIIVPLFLPAAVALGVDPLQFAMVVILCWGIGQQTPPVGAALFITSVIAKTDVMSLTRANVPFIGVMVVVLILTILFPETLVQTMPRLFGL
jgi:tripartite ATP-independent transporter DctM subunit